MFELVVFGWAGKALLTALLVAVLLRLMQRWGQRVCGLVTGLPTVSAPALLWLAASQGDDFAVLAGAGTVAAGALSALFAFGYARASRRGGPGPALAAAAAVGLLPAVLLVQLELGLGLLLAGAVASGLVCVAALRPVRAGRTARQPSCSPSRVVVTASVAGVVSGVVGLLAGDLGAFWSGLVAGAPLVAAIVVVRVHLDCGGRAVQEFMHAYCAGVVGRSLLTAVFCLLVPALGSALAMLVACMALAAAWAMLAAWRSWWAVLAVAGNSQFVVSASDRHRRVST